MEVTYVDIPNVLPFFKVIFKWRAWTSTKREGINFPRRRLYIQKLWYTVKVNIFMKRNVRNFRAFDIVWELNFAASTPIITQLLLQKAIFASFYFCVFVFTCKIRQNKSLAKISTSTVSSIPFPKILVTNITWQLCPLFFIWTMHEPQFWWNFEVENNSVKPNFIFMLTKFTCNQNGL